MKGRIVLAFLSLLLSIATATDYGQIGIIDSGTVELEKPVANEATTINFNFNLGATPYFGFGLTGLELPPANTYKILYDVIYTSTKATISWDILLPINRLKIRWMASKGDPTYLRHFRKSNPTNGNFVEQTLSPGMPTTLSSLVVHVGLLISGFDYSGGLKSRNRLNIKLLPPEIRYQTAQAAQKIMDFTTQKVRYNVNYKGSGDDTATLRTIIITVFVSVDRNQLHTGASSREFDQVPSQLDFYHERNSIPIGNMDYLFGINSIDIGENNPNNLILSVDYNVHNVRHVYLTSVSPSTFTSSNNHLLGYINKAAKCLYAADQVTPFIFTTCSDLSCTYSGSTLAMSLGATTTVATFQRANIPVGTYILKYRPIVSKSNSIIKYQIIDSSGSVITEMSETGWRLSTAQDNYMFFQIKTATSILLKISMSNPGAQTASISITLDWLKRFKDGQQYIYDYKSNQCIPVNTCKYLGWRLPEQFYCVECSDDMVFNPTTNQCQCPTGTDYDENTLLCVPCGVGFNCQTYQTAGFCQCASCPPGRKLQGGKCVCPDGKYPMGTFCEPCAQYCQTCSNSAGCSSCKQAVRIGDEDRQTNRMLDSRMKCVCREGYYEGDGVFCEKCGSNCAACTEKQGECTRCEVGSYRIEDNNKECKNCQANCLTCQEADGICTECQDGYYRKEGTDKSCSPCEQGCSLCSLDGSCEQCITGSYYISPIISTICLPCSDPFCLQCSSTTCLQCSPPFILVGSTCHCPSGTYLNVQSCSSCSSNCLQCTSSTTCTQCSTNYVLISGSCQLSCPAGHYKLNNGCAACSSPCTTCQTTATTCTSCTNPKILLGSTCVGNCPDGYFDMKTVNKCGKCIDNCKTCQGNEANCKSCYDGFTLKGGVSGTGENGKCQLNSLTRN